MTGAAANQATAPIPIPGQQQEPVQNNSATLTFNVETRPFRHSPHTPSDAYTSRNIQNTLLGRNFGIPPETVIDPPVNCHAAARREEHFGTTPQDQYQPIALGSPA
jgi:hypothetical protein